MILNQLGENVASPAEARAARDAYIQILDALATGKLAANISVKLTQLGLDFDRDLCFALTEEIVASAAQRGAAIEMDMEGSAYTEATIAIFEALLLRHRNMGIALQAYLRRSENDLERLAPLGPKIRLVKGAYREPVHLAFQKKSEVDKNYRRLLDRMLQPASVGVPETVARGSSSPAQEKFSLDQPQAQVVDAQPQFIAAIATHDPLLIAYAQKKIREYALPADRYEFQMIYGIRRDLQEQLHVAGFPLRVYVPFGTAWVPYFMRRLAERPANVWFVLRSLLAERRRPAR